MSGRYRILVSALFTLGAFVLALLAAKNAGGANKVTTVAVPGGGRAVSAKTDSEGNIYLLFDSPEGPQYAKSTDNGKTFLKSIPILDRESQKPGLEFNAWDLAIGPKGRVHVAMGTNAWKLKLPKEEWGFFYAALEPEAKSFSPVRNINRKPSEGFSLAADEKGNVTACWLSDKLYANVSRDNGKTFDQYEEIDSSYDPCNCCTTAATYGADGKLAVLYREETNNERDMYLVLWDQSTNEKSRTRVSSTLWKLDACPMTYYAIVPSKEGYTAVWPTNGPIYFARLDAKGALLSPAEVKTPGTTGMRTGMTALHGSDGATLITWKKDNQLGWQLYDQRGRPSGRPGSASSTGSGAAGVVAKNGDFILLR